MESKCLDQLTSSLILASMTLIACILRSDFLIAVLLDTTQPKPYVQVDGNINILLCINLMAYVLLGLMSILLIFAVIKKHHLLMLPWLVAALVSAFCEVLFVIYTLVQGHSKNVLLILIGTALSLWIIWAIFSSYKTIRQENNFKQLENIQGYRYSTAAVTGV